MAPRPFVIDQSAPTSNVRIDDVFAGMTIDVDRAPRHGVCGDFGVVRIRPRLSPPNTPSDAMGFIVARIDGSLPDGLELPTGAVMLDGQGEIALFWPDTGTDFLALFSVTPVDRSGTRGTGRSALVESTHPPREIRLVVGVIGMVLTFLGGAAFGAIAMKKRRPSA
jgi:hypothetical protein